VKEFRKHEEREDIRMRKIDENTKKTKDLQNDGMRP